jgi:hypothetical protein
LFSCSACPDSFSALLRASGPVFMFCTPGHVFCGTNGVGSRFHALRSWTHFRLYRGRRFPFSAPGLVFGGTEGVGSRFHILRSRTRFWQYRGRQVPFSYFVLSDSFSTVPRASDPVFIFYASGLVFCVTEGVECRFLVLHGRTYFRRYRGRRVPFSYFVLPDTFSTVPRASGPVFIFYAPRLIFGVTESVECRFLVLHVRTHFRRYRGHRVPFSYFALPESFSAIPRVPAPVFMFCAPGVVSPLPRASGPVFLFCMSGLIFGGTNGVWSRFHILLARTRFWRSRGDVSRFHVLLAGTRFRRYRGRRVPFLYFALSNIFSAEQMASSTFFICVPGLIFGGTEGVGTLFHILRSQSRFSRTHFALSGLVLIF